MSTTDTTAAAPPAGWYPDPTGRHERRWWDGAVWTTEVADQVAAGEGGEPLGGVVEPPVASPEETPADESAEEKLGKAAVPPELRPSTGAGIDGGPSRRTLVLSILGALVLLGAFSWGYENYTTADKWRDRGEELQARLDDTNSNADAVEEALSNAASRRARMEDSFQTVGELREATEATISQLNSCVTVLNGLLNTIASGADPAPGIERANQVCGEAGMNGATLADILRELERG